MNAVRMSSESVPGTEPNSSSSCSSSPLLTMSLARERSGRWFWGRFCACTSRPAQRKVRAAPPNCKRPCTRPSLQMHRAMDSYFFTLVRDSSSRSSSSSFTMPSASAVFSCTMRLDRLSMGISISASHALSWLTLPGFSSPVNALALWNARSENV